MQWLCYGFLIKRYCLHAVYYFIMINYTSRLYLSMHHEHIEMATEMMMATMNPKRLVSMPLTRFMPKSEATSVGNIMMMVMLVSVRSTPFILLLMILEYVSIVDSRMSEYIPVSSRA